jgi:DNA-binding response OmpR family regulator
MCYGSEDGISTMSNDREETLPRVLLVDDEKEVADAYALRLDGVADVTITYSGEEALSAVDPSTPPDIVMLDRHMPGMSGDEVLKELFDTDMQTRIIMVTAIDPGLDILELPFDEYLCKPVEREDVRAAVNQQCQVLAYALLGEYFQLESRRAVIEAQLPPERLAEHEKFQEIENRTDELHTRISRLLPEADDVFATFADIDREGY